MKIIARFVLLGVLLTVISFSGACSSISGRAAEFEKTRENAYALYREGNFPKAKNAYEDCLSIRPTDAESHLYLGHCLKALGEMDKAEAEYKKAKEIDPGIAIPKINKKP